MADININAEVKSNVGEVAKDAENASNEFAVMGVSLNGVKAGFKSAGVMAKSMFGSIKAGIMSTGIGALLLAVAALGKYFTSTEEGASKLKMIFAALGVVVGNIEDLLTTLGKTLYDTFTNPKQAVKDLWEAIKTNFMNRIDGLIDMSEALGKVIESVFTLDWEGAKEGVLEYGESVTQVLTGVDDLFGKAADSIKKFGEETRREIGEAIQLEAALLALQQKERKHLVDKSKAEMEISQLRTEARDFENFSAKERLEKTERAIELSKEQLAIDLEIGEEKLRQKQLENTFNNSDADALNEEAQLEANLFNLKKNNFALLKGFAGELKAVKAEIFNAEKAEAAALKAQEDKEWAEKIKKNDEWNKKQIADAKKVADQKKLIAKKLEAAKTATIEMGANVATAIAGEGSAVAKTVAVAMAVMNTKNAVTAALGAVPYGPWNIAQAVATGIFGMTQVAGIMSTPIPGGGGGGGGGGAVAAAPAPQMMSGAFELGGGIEPEPVKAFVVTDEMTSSQNQLANIRRRATI